MNKILVMLFLSLIVLGVALNAPILVADEDDNDSSGRNSNSNAASLNDDEDEENEVEDEENETEDDEREDIRKRVKEKLKEEFRKEVRLPDGRRIIIERKVEVENGKIKIEIKKKITLPDGTVQEIEIKIEKDENGVTRKVEINGVNVGLEDIEVDDLFEGNESELNVAGSDVKIKMKVLPERAKKIVRNRLHGNVSNLTLEEVRHKNIPRVVYKVNSEHPGRFLGIFKLVLKAETQIDPETGEVLSVNAPWWVTFVTGTDLPDEEDVVGNETISDDDEDELEDEEENDTEDEVENESE